MKRMMMCFGAAVVAVTIAGGIAAADQVIATFNEDYVPANPGNTFGSFTHGQFSGAVTDGASSLIFDVMDSGGDSGAFGGIGVDYGTYNSILMGLLPIDFDPATAYWEVRVKVLENNAATAIRTSAPTWTSLARPVTSTCTSST